MILDFEKFKVTVQLAYRRIGKCAYSLDVVLQVAENFEKQHKDVLESICKLISQMSSAENSAR